MPTYQMRPITSLVHSTPLAHLIGRAFLADPVFTANYPVPADRLRHTTELYTGDLRNCLQYGSVWTAQSPSGDPIGAITLLDMPKRSNLPDSATHTTIWEELIARFDPDERDGLELLDTTQSTPWRYISVLAVDPDHQGTGIGTDLLNHTIATADHDRRALGIMTEIPRTVRYYQRFGFHIIHEGSESDPVRFWVLLRPTP